MAQRSDLIDVTLFNPQIARGLGLNWMSADATAEMALSANMPPILNLDPAGSSKVVLLPTEASMRGKVMYIRNAADAQGELLTVEEDSSTTVQIVLNRGEVGVLFSDGTSWFVFAHSAGFGADAASSRIMKTVKTALTATTSTSGGGVLSVANPEGVRLIITRFILDITTGSTGAATADIGVAADGTTSNDTLMDGTNLQTTGATDNIENQGTNGVSAKVWTSTQFVTATGSASSVGLVGSAYITYMVA